MSAPMKGAIIFGVIILVVVFACVGPAFFWLPQAGVGVPLPVITLPGEPLVPNWPIQGYDFTNTLTSLLVVDLLAVVMVIVVRRAVLKTSPDRFVPRGFTHFVELLVEFMYNQAKSMLGKNTRKVFPLAMSVFMFLLIANWVKLIPGVESIGIIACAETNQPGYNLSGAAAPYSLNVNALDLGKRAGTKATEADAHACEEEHPQFIPPAVLGKIGRGELAKAETTAATETKGTTESKGTTETKAAANPNLFVVVPFFRGLATDLNFPLALALIVVVMVQVWGVSELKLAYFYKFINLPALGNLSKKPLGAIDFIVGLVEIISEISRIISLSFRLFGNIFAGGVLLIVMTFLMAGVLPSIFYFLEIFVGLIQAYVFAVLTLIYASQAMIAHGDGEHGDHEHEAHAEAAHA